ncbi:hypothetical protein SAMN05892883_0960 [Jatrophihabitans sp. GAS493]|uniref:SCO6745 family protein n=1 Tax=Jatrophihabitans sp. GAS493 TaxID=1907575 RepID=UPI000BB942AA|nr:hypothetical protein [Jatrophihabitans sp. GAS493]SOD71438.1 hypothetical protein SAMN05892883_0960 [Jatrophihabitans sp. GAS493]
MNVRELGRLTESIHAVVYFAPEAQQAYLELGLRGYWRGYFASRGAALALQSSAPSAELVTRLFGGFAPTMVARAVPEVWGIAAPTDIVAARQEAATAALRRLIPPRIWPDDRGFPVTIPRPEVTGRPMAAAQAGLGRPDEPLAALWHDCTVLREHRGDGHLLALVEAGFTWPQPHVLLAAAGQLDANQREYRGWSEQEWRTAASQLRDCGLLDQQDQPTPAGIALLEEIEARTDELAAEAYAAFDADAVAQLADSLRPLAEAAAGGIPFPNAMGLRSAPPTRGG